MGCATGVGVAFAVIRLLRPPLAADQSTMDPLAIAAVVLVLVVAAGLASLSGTTSRQRRPDYCLALAIAPRRPAMEFSVEVAQSHHRHVREIETPIPAAPTRGAV